MSRTTMITVCKDFRFAAAHAIRGHRGGCENLHGHNYRVRVCVRADALDELGMVLDFADLHAITEEVLGRFDHRVINELPPFDQRNTTAELFAEWAAGEIATRLPRPEGRRLELARVEVWENDTSFAAWEP